MHLCKTYSVPLFQTRKQYQQLKPLNVFYASCKGNEEKWKHRFIYNDIIADINSMFRFLIRSALVKQQHACNSCRKHLIMLFAILEHCVIGQDINAFTSFKIKQQMGILRSIGASKRQRIYLCQRNCRYCGYCPYSVNACFLFRHKIIVSNMSEHAIFIPQISVLLISAAVGVLAVCLVSLILSFAVRISPMQAVRNIEKTKT